MRKVIINSAALLALLVLLGTAGSVWAQEKVYRPEGTFFLKPGIGLSTYFGDNEKTPLNFNGDAFDLGTPLGLSGELGYQLSVPFSLSLSLVYGSYPVITQFPPYTLSDGSTALRRDSDVENDPTNRLSVQALGRYTLAESTQRSALFFNFGLSSAFGTVRQNTPPNFNQEESAFAFGPVVGLGLDFALNARSSFFVEMNAGIHFGDDQLDGNADNGGLIGAADILAGLSAGVKINFAAAITPVGLHNLTCPKGIVILGEDQTFSVETNAHATEPVSIHWSFSEEAGSTVETHAFVDDGEVVVTVTAENPAGPVSDECTVTVVEPPTIVTVTPNKNTVSTCDEDPSVAFGANLRGSAPLTYSWDFGDGNTSSDANPSHTYAELGNYEVTLTVTNDGGSATEATQIAVTDEGCFDCNIAEMNSVFFDRNSSVINAETTSGILGENLEALQNCEFSVQILGHASRDERNPQQLSEDRARAVAQYYIDNGIDAARLEVVGMGATIQTTKRSGAAQFRRADTIPPGGN